MRVRHLLTLMLIALLAVMPGTSMAAAICVHQDAVAHAEARHAADPGTAAIALAEEAAAVAAAKQGAPADAGAFALHVFLLPASQSATVWMEQDGLPRPSQAASHRRGRSIAPLLEPPSA